MSTKLLEKKISSLEERVALLESSKRPASNPQAWRNAVSYAKDDDLFDKAMDLGAKLRKKASAAGR